MYLLHERAVVREAFTRAEAFARAGSSNGGAYMCVCVCVYVCVCVCVYVRARISSCVPDAAPIDIGCLIG